MGGCYCYDGSLAGLLCLYQHLLLERPTVAQISTRLPDQPQLFATEISIATDQDLAEQFWQQLQQRLSPHSRKLVRCCLLADHPQQELLLYRYLVLEAEAGSQINGMLAHPAVAPAWKLAQQVGREAHRYLGFVRFQQVDGELYFAAIAPEHRILLMIGEHFRQRFKDQSWLIHDQRHGEGILYDCAKQEWLLVPMELHTQPKATLQELQFQALWRSYFQTLAIPERENRRLQQGKVPFKLRAWLTEFNG